MLGINPAALPSFQGPVICLLPTPPLSLQNSWKASELGTQQALFYAVLTTTLCNNGHAVISPVLQTRKLKLGGVTCPRSHLW